MKGLRLAAAFAILAAPVGSDEAYRAEIAAWREAREARLKAEGGWLSVAGLFWLPEGVSRFGAGPGVDFVLPAGSAPPVAGEFVRKGTSVSVSLAAGVSGTVGEQPIGGEPRPLQTDATGQPDVLRLGRLSLHVIARGDRLGVRLKDPESATRKNFTGLHWYEVAESYRVVARYVPYDTPHAVRVPNILGQSEEMPSPGYASFTMDGKDVRLEGVLESPDADELFFILKDQTSGRGTYPAGRFLYAPLPKDGVVVLDFNKAYNPPCAFTEFATCPLPPRQNWMPVAVRAGEKDYGHR